MSIGLGVSVVLASVMLAGCASDAVGPRDSGDAGAYPGAYDDDRGGGTVRCESDHGRRRHCDMDTRGGVFLSRRDSSTPCIRGRNWDVDDRGVWVSSGCRAEFATGSGSAPRGARVEGVVVRCESQDGHWRHCDTPIVRGAKLRRNVSRTPCILGDNWGWDPRGVWVNYGCRGDFEVF